jgi:hypothetical protein
MASIAGVIGSPVTETTELGSSLRRTFVARQPVHHPFCQPPLAGQAIHDLHFGQFAGDGA